MAGEVRLEGALTIKPFGVSENVFPTSKTDIPLDLLNGGTRSWTVQKLAFMDINSPSAFVAVPSVILADMLYLRCDAALLVELTWEQVPPTADLVSIVTLYGLMILEFPPDQLLKTIRVQGVAQLEIFVCGAS